MFRRMWAHAWRTGDQVMAKALASTLRRSAYLWFMRGVLFKLSPTLARRWTPALERMVGLGPELGPAWPNEGPQPEAPPQ